jgi:hypothetical protein
MPNQNLFQKPSKKEQLLSYIRALRYVKTSEVINWGSDHYSNRADRDARQLAQEGKIRRLSKEERMLRFGNIKEFVYEALTK